MLKIACGVLVFFGLALSAAAVSAQDAPSGRWWNSPQVTKQLNLTSGEKQQLESAYRDSRRKLIQKKSRVEAEQFELENLMGQPKIDEKAVRAQNRKLEKARSDLANEKFAFVVEVRKIIGHDRFQKLVNIHRSGGRY
jgi:Spy/CpxP family protein refolding chaperone